MTPSISPANQTPPGDAGGIRVDATVTRRDVFWLRLGLLHRDKVVWVMALAALAANSLRLIGPWRRPFGLIIQSFSVVLIGMTILVIVTNLLLIPLVAAKRRNGNLGICSYEVTDQGLLCDTPCGRSLYYWASILWLRRGPCAIGIFLNETNFLVIPKHAFPTRGDFEAFWVQLAWTYLTRGLPETVC
jgi:hypothetical protein